MKIIGITGGIGSGKTAVLDIMQRDYGAFIMEADALAHRLMEPGQISYNDIVEHFGRDILDEDSRIDRAKLSAVVFSDQKQLDILNSITHPNVKRPFLNPWRSRKSQDADYTFLKLHCLSRMGIWTSAMRCGMSMQTFQNELNVCVLIADLPMKKQEKSSLRRSLTAIMRKIVQKDRQFR